MAKSVNVPIEIEVLIFEGCPHAAATIALTREVAGSLAPGTSIVRTEVDTPEKAESLGFLGSPSVRVNGEDIEQRSTDRGSLCCRTYSGSGIPPRWMIEAAIVKATQPKGILFLCVANSARSQMAEGIARSLAPPEVSIWSAGSRPTSVRPQAIVVLQEIGIDISGHRSKSVAEIPASEVDTVITLCGEEECPVFLGKAKRLHWGLSDPAAANGAEKNRLSAFREIRDELRQRIELLFR